MLKMVAKKAWNFRIEKEKAVNLNIQEIFNWEKAIKNNIKN